MHASREDFTFDAGPACVSAAAYRAPQGPIGATLLLAHGAGANHTSPFMVRYATALANGGLDVVTFNFPYMEARKRVPDPPATLERCYRAAMAAVRGRPRIGEQPLLIGGKSMGGRIATQVAADSGTPRGEIAGIVLLGYPLHPPGRSAQLRARHLPHIVQPMLFVQGARDTFGTPDELRPVLAPLGRSVTVFPVNGGDHGFNVPKKWPVPQSHVEAEIQGVILTWIATLAKLTAE